MTLRFEVILTSFVTVRSTVYKPHTAHNSSIRSDKGLTLETSAFEFLYGGQFTLSTQLIKPNYLVILPTDAAPQFRYWETYPSNYPSIQLNMWSTPHVRYLPENLKPRPCLFDLEPVRSKQHGLGLRFPVKTSLSVARKLKQTTTKTPTRTSPNKRFNEQNNSCARAF